MLLARSPITLSQSQFVWLALSMFILPLLGFSDIGKMLQDSCKTRNFGVMKTGHIGQHEATKTFSVDIIIILKCGNYARRPLNELYVR